MKKYGLMLFMLCCAHVAWTQHAIQDVAWLKGQWKRTNARPGRSGFETWVVESDSVLLGKGITRSGEDTVFVENIRIVLHSKELYYIADVAENAAPVSFKFTVVKPQYFVCENPDHDFPKQISYALVDGKLKAMISGNGKSIEYWFERIR
jgi:Domain of unknown function (DUF6265)